MSSICIYKNAFFWTANKIRFKSKIRAKRNSYFLIQLSQQCRLFVLWGCCGFSRLKCFKINFHLHSVVITYEVNASANKSFFFLIVSATFDNDADLKKLKNLKVKHQIFCRKHTPEHPCHSDNRKGYILQTVHPCLLFLFLDNNFLCPEIHDNV